MNSTHLLILAAILCSASTSGQSLSPLNGKPLPLDVDEGFSFLVAGHIYGSPGSGSAYPSSAFQGSIGKFNKLGLSFIVTLGDSYRLPDRTHLENFRESIVERVEPPLFNAVGNHEVGSSEGRSLYQNVFGATHGHFIVGRAAFIILDTEHSGGRLPENQVEFLRSTVEDLGTQPGVRDVFVLTHKLIWAVEDPDFRILFEHSNAPKDYAASNNFRSDVLPILARLGKTKKVCLISGDIGCPWSLPLFYERHHASGFTFAATGIGDTRRDAVIRVDVPSSSGPVTFTPISLTESAVSSMETYGLSYWREHFEDSQRPAGLRQIIALLTGRSFWVGLGSGALFIFLIDRMRTSKPDRANER